MNYSPAIVGEKQRYMTLTGHEAKLAVAIQEAEGDNERKVNLLD